MSLRTAHCSFAFCLGHRLLHYEGKCKNVHGHNCELEISVGSSNMTAEGFIMDFSALKEVAKTWIDDVLDHGFIANCYDSVVLDMLASEKLKYYSLTPGEMTLYYKAFKLSLPASDTALCNPTMENLVVFITYQISKLLDKKVPDVRILTVKLRESGSGWVEFNTGAN